MNYPKELPKTIEELRVLLDDAYEDGYEGYRLATDYSSRNMELYPDLAELKSSDLHLFKLVKILLKDAFIKGLEAGYEQGVAATGTSKEV